MKQEQIVIVSVLISLFAFTIHHAECTPFQFSSSNPPPLCEPGIVEELPGHLKRVCMLIENSNQLNSALNQYIKNEAAALMVKADELAPGPGAAGKRTDVDHVFLRFGRRR